MNNATLIGAVRTTAAGSFVLEVDRANGPSDLVPVTGAASREGDRLVVEGSLRVRRRELVVKASAIHRLPDHHMV